MSDTALSAHDQFFAAFHALPRYSVEDQHRLATLACRGDKQARQQFVESLIPYVVKYARDLVGRFPHLTLLEIIQIGNATLTEYVDRALWAENPSAYLLKTANYTMYHQCVRYSSPVSTPRTYRPYEFISLDEPVNEGSETVLADLLIVPAAASSPEQDHSLLYSALAQLPEERRDLLARWFGLLGYPVPESLYDLAHEMLPDVPAKQAYGRLLVRVKRALAILSERMAAGHLPEQPAISQEFYTSVDIERQYGIDRFKLLYWVKKGWLTRHMAPPEWRCDGTPGGPVSYVYDKAEVDALVEKRLASGRQSGEQRDGQSSLVPLHARRPTPNAQRQALASREEVA